MIRAQNLDSFDATVQGWFEAVEEAVAEAAVGLANEAFEQLLESSPQYSGDFVANWKVGKQPDYSFSPMPGRAGHMDPFQMGSTPAMEYARAHAVWPDLKLGESVYITNSAAHDEPYAVKIENGMIKLRPVNEGASHIVRRAVLTLGFNYTTIGPVQLDILRKFGK